MKRLALLFLLAASCMAQTNSAVVTWTDTLNPPGTPYNVYRLAGTCPPAPVTSTAGFTVLNNTPITGMTLVDSAINPNTTYAWVVTAIVNGAETAPSPCGQGTVPPPPKPGVPPQSITIIIK